MNKYIFSFLTIFFVTFTYADTTSSITGDVNVSDVTVTITHIPTGSVKKVTTDGDFRFSSLRPGGPYKIVASKSGYETETLNNVFLALNDNVNFNISLVSSEDIEDVTVVGTKLGILATGPGVDLSSRDIELTPGADRSFADIVKRDPRIAVSGTFRDSEITALGVSPRMNNFTVDGAEANDSFGLNDNGFASVRNPWERAVSLYSRKEGVQVSKNISFEEFIEHHFYASDTCAIPSLHKNQFDWLSDENGELLMDYVFRLEDFSQAIKEIESRTSGRIVLQERIENKNSDSRSSGYQEIYNSNTKNIIAKRFEKDIDFFKFKF